MAAFLTATLDAVEATARAATPGPWKVDEVYDGWPAVVSERERHGYVAGAQYCDAYDQGASEMEPADVAHIALHDPRSALAQVEADRAILALHAPWDTSFTGRLGHVALILCSTCENKDYPCDTVRARASAYRHRPGWDPAWCPDVAGRVES